MASVVDICNSALNLLGASTISALTEDSKNARLCNQRYEPIRDRTFRSHAWNCLTKRVQLAEDSAAPVVEYANQFTLPTDCLRVLKVHNGTTDSIASSLDYAVEGRKIKTDELFCAKTKYNQNNEVTSGFLCHQIIKKSFEVNIPNFYFIIALICSLYVMICPPIVKSIFKIGRAHV